jgi:hypothetical protein
MRSHPGHIDNARSAIAECHGQPMTRLDRHRSDASRSRRNHSSGGIFFGACFD